jgi:hypothetical protein
LNIFFAGDQQHENRLRMQHNISANLQKTLMDTQDDVYVKKYDMKQTVLSNLSTDDKEGSYLLKLIAEEISAKI